MSEDLRQSLLPYLIELMQLYKTFVKPKILADRYQLSRGIKAFEK